MQLPRPASGLGPTGASMVYGYLTLRQHDNVEIAEGILEPKPGAGTQDSLKTVLTCLSRCWVGEPSCSCVRGHNLPPRPSLCVTDGTTA